MDPGENCLEEELDEQKQLEPKPVAKPVVTSQQTLDQPDADPLRVIESALFLGNRKLAYAELAMVAKTTVKKARSLAEQLAKEYAGRESAVEVALDVEGAMMQVKGAYLSPVARLSREIELSGKATRMLALIAKKGAILQSELHKYFRGDIYSYMAELKELGYVSSEKKGATRLLKPTKKFHEAFQLGGEGAIQTKAAEPVVQEKLQSPTEAKPDGQ